MQYRFNIIIFSYNNNKLLALYLVEMLLEDIMEIRWYYVNVSLNFKRHKVK